MIFSKIEGAISDVDQVVNSGYNHALGFMRRNSEVRMEKWKSIMLIAFFYVGCPMYSVKVIDQYEKTNLVIVSDDIGESFDAEEAKKYRLFPKTKGFIEARFYDIDPGGYELEVITKSAKYKALYGEEMLPQILKDYIENFDSICGSDSVFKDKWRIIAYDQQRLPITLNEVDSVGKGHEFASNVGLMAVLGCLGGISIGAMIGGIAYVAYGVSGDDYNIYDAIFVGAAIGTSLSVLMSLAKGRADDRRDAVNAIKKSRKLRKVVKK